MKRWITTANNNNLDVITSAYPDEKNGMLTYKQRKIS